MPIPSDIKQLRSLLVGLSYHRKFLPDLARRIRPITALQKNGATFEFTPTMEHTIRALLTGLVTPPIYVFPDWDAVTDKSRHFRLHCDARMTGFGATLDEEQRDGSIRPMAASSGTFVI